MNSPELELEYAQVLARQGGEAPEPSPMSLRELVATVGPHYLRPEQLLEAYQSAFDAEVAKHNWL